MYEIEPSEILWKQNIFFDFFEKMENLNGIE